MAAQDLTAQVRYSNPLATLANLLSNPSTRLRALEDVLCHCFEYERSWNHSHEAYVTMRRFVQRVPALDPIREQMDDYCTSMISAICVRELEEYANMINSNLEPIRDALTDPKMLLTEENLENTRQMCDSMLNDLKEFIESIIPDQIDRPTYLHAATRDVDAAEDKEFNDCFKVNLRCSCCGVANGMTKCDEPMRILSQDPPNIVGPAPRLVELYDLINDIYVHTSYQGPPDQIRPRKAMRYDD